MSDIPDAALGCPGQIGGPVDDLPEGAFLRRLLFDLLFYLFPSGLGGGGKGEGEKIENHGQPCTADEKRFGQGDGAHARSQQGNGFPVAGKVGQHIEGGEKNGDREDGLGEVWKLDEEVFGKEGKRWIFFHESPEFVENIEHQPENEKGGDYEAQRDQDGAPKIFFDDFHVPCESRNSTFMNLAHDLSALEETVKRCHALVPAVEAAGRALAERVKAGGKVLTCGNGGSAADSMHFAEEMTGRYRRNRKALPALALCADGSALTCIANDWSYEDVFSRQVEAFGQKGDVLIVFSTSGKSPNILKAIGVAKSRNMLVIGALGKDGGPAKGQCDHAIVVPSEDSSRIQEIHGWLIHSWLECVEELAVGKE